MSPKIFVVILNWNKPDLTLECVESIKKANYTDCSLTIVVVDNGSSDNSIAKLSELKVKNAKYELVKNSENLGFAEGNNIGIRYALEQGADYVLVLNNDTLVDKNIFKEFVLFAQSNPQVGVISPKIYFAKGYEFHDNYKPSDLGKVIWSAGGDIDWKNVYGVNHGVDEVDKGQFESTREIDFASGACMFLTRNALLEAGLFDKKYFMYMEDVELTQRIKKKGMKSIYTPKAVIWHKVAQSSAIGGALNDYFITRNRLLFGVGVFGNGYASFRAKVALTREALRFLVHGRKWQKKGVIDFYLLRYGKGSWN